MVERIKAADLHKITPKAKRADREGPIHKAILAYLRAQLPDALIHHSPNETDLKGKDVARAIAKQKRLGMMVGFPDILVIWRANVWGFEVKAPGNYASSSQKDVGKLLHENAGKWAVVRSVEDVKECIAQWRKSGPLTVLEMRGDASWKSIGDLAADLVKDVGK